MTKGTMELTTLTTVAQVLTQARKLIEKGWCQHVNMRESGGKVAYCAQGAVIKVAPMSLRLPSLVQLRRVTPSSITGWNDELGRTKAEVLAVYDRAIVRVTSTRGSP